MDRDYREWLKGVKAEIRKTFTKEIAENFFRKLIAAPIEKMQLRVMYHAQSSPKDYWRWYRFE